VGKQCHEKGCRRDSRYQVELKLRGASLKTWELCTEARDRLDLVITDALAQAPSRKKRRAKVGKVSEEQRADTVVKGLQ
jgi:hypothetical protein